MQNLVAKNLYTPAQGWIYSFNCSLSYNRSTACSKASSKQCDLVLLLSVSSILISLRSSNSCLCLLPCLPVIFILPSITCCKRQFLCKMWPIQLAFLLYIACGTFLSSLTPCNTLNFSHDRYSWSPSFSSNTFQNFPGISRLLSQVSKFQCDTKLCFIHSTSLISSPRLSPICWRISVVAFEE